MESHPLVYIRTDGNETIATGHLMRCLSIARALKKRGAAVAFLVSDDTSASILQKMYSPDEIADHSFPILELRTDYRSLDREIQTMQGILSSHNVACLLVDSYFATPEYLDILRQICKVAYLDDLQAFDCPASLVINYDFCVDESFYTKADCVLTGCAYTPLREQFADQPYHLWEQVKDLFLSTGGTDPFYIAGGMLKRLCASDDWKDVSFHVLTGPMHVHRAELAVMAGKDSRIVLHEQVSHMAALMSTCDLAFSAGGTTLYELCAVGVPSVSFSMADNQLPGVKAFDDANLIPWAGDIRDNEIFYDDAVEKLTALLKNPVYMPDADAAENAMAYLEACIAEQNSSGGVVECIISGVPAGIGDPVFEKLNANLAKAVMSIGAVKGFEIGDGFDVAKATGKNNNDAFRIGADGSVSKETNHAGGILGGMSDGSDIILRATIKPTPSISATQHTVNKSGEEIDINIKGRHDPVIVPRAVVVVESMAAITIVDAMFANMSARMDSLERFYK